MDNTGSVGIWRKGYSNFCSLSTTIVKAISVVAAGLGCHVDILKVTRCSSRGPILADLVSKAQFMSSTTSAAPGGWGMGMSLLTSYFLLRFQFRWRLMEASVTYRPFLPAHPACW